MEIWKLSMEIGDQLFEISDYLEKDKKYRFSEQLRGAGMSISNNIAEGAGSFSNAEFKLFLNYARRSTFECANIIIILLRRKLITPEQKNFIFNKLLEISCKTTNFRKSLK